VAGWRAAVDGVTGESASIRALDVDVRDATGAGDVFGAGFVAATLAGWPLADRLRFANRGAAPSDQRFGGALSAPGWAGLARWWPSVYLDVQVLPARGGIRGSRGHHRSGRNQRQAHLPRSRSASWPGKHDRDRNVDNFFPA
jgi:hypothetical protein